MCRCNCRRCVEATSRPFFLLNIHYFMNFQAHHQIEIKFLPAPTFIPLSFCKKNILSYPFSYPSSFPFSIPTPFFLSVLMAPHESVLLIALDWAVSHPPPTRGTVSHPYAVMYRYSCSGGSSKTYSWHTTMGNSTHRASDPPFVGVHGFARDLAVVRAVIPMEVLKIISTRGSPESLVRCHKQQI